MTGSGQSSSSGFDPVLLRQKSRQERGDLLHARLATIATGSPNRPELPGSTLIGGVDRHLEITAASL